VDSQEVGGLGKVAVRALKCFANKRPFDFPTGVFVEDSFGQHFVNQAVQLFSQ